MKIISLKHEALLCDETTLLSERMVRNMVLLYREETIQPGKKFLKPNRSKTLDKQRLRM
jgi:hypothetical protein